jgi:hypothetical protein
MDGMAFGNWIIPGGFLYLSFMEGNREGFEKTSFSQEPIYFSYFDVDDIEQLLIANGITIMRIVRQDYSEPDGGNTIDVFIFGQKL